MSTKANNQTEPEKGKKEDPSPKKQPPVYKTATNSEKSGKKK